MRGPRPAWAGPPEAHRAGIVPIRRVIADATGPPRVMIELTEARAYRQGCLFEITTTAFHPDPAAAPWRDEPAMPMMLLQRLRPGQPLPEQLLRFAVVLPDGAVATTLHPRRHYDQLHQPHPPEPEQPLLTPVLGAIGGGGPGDERILTVRAPLWLWPAPPAADFDLAVEWPAYGIDETRTRLDGTALAEASASAEPYWPDLR